MFKHSADTPTVFFFDTLGEQEKEILEWFVERQVMHSFRALLNAERDKHGTKYEINFYEARDAVEFKLKFL